MLTCIVGINWGGEGKGRMTDLLSRDQDIVCRFQGGRTGGHIVVTGRDAHLISQLPSAILRPDVMCVMGNGMTVDLTSLEREIIALREKGVSITPRNLKISDRAMMDLGLGLHHHTMRMIDLLDPSSVHGLYPDETEAFGHFADFFKEFICDVGRYLTEADRYGKRILLEAESGALRDKDFGIPAFALPSNSIAAYAPIGAGIPGLKINRTVGVMKAYSSCEGKGPFVSELTDMTADIIRDAGHEYASLSGKPRRVGAFDAVASRFGIMIQGADEIALTKLDALSFTEQIPICIAYECDGVMVQDMPLGDRLERAKPVIEYVEGWNCDISHCQTYSELPIQAMTYIKYLEELIRVPITYISVSPERAACIRV